MKKATVIGATGLVGKNVVYQLLKSNDYSKVVLILRKEMVISDPKLEQHVINFDNMSEYADLFKVDEVFCCLGSTIKKAETKEAFEKVDRYYCFMAASLARANGVTHFLMVSALGANKYSNIFYNRIKGEAEDDIDKLGFLCTSIFRPSLLTGPRSEFRFSEWLGIMIMKPISVFLKAKLQKYALISGENVAKAMVKSASLYRGGKHIYEGDKIISLLNV
jgi:uncharacterized protein YbjT (DUF2867 family)